MPIPQREIVHALKVSRATVSDLVEVLRAQGPLATAQGAEDKCHVQVALTPAGRAPTARIALDNADRLRGEFVALSNRTLTALADALVRLSPISGQLARQDQELAASAPT